MRLVSAAESGSCGLRCQVPGLAERMLSTSMTLSLLANINARCVKGRMEGRKDIFILTSMNIQ